jgi:DNA polymerase-3 subunit beta
MAVKRLAPAISGSAADGRIRVEARAGAVHLSAYGRDSALTVAVPADPVDPELDVVVNGRLLVDFVGAADGRQTDLATRAHLFTVHAGGSDLEVPIYSASSWLALGHVVGESVEWPADAPAQLARVTHAASTDEYRQVMRGVALGSGHAVATDDDRLSMIELPVGHGQQIIVPAPALETLERLHDGLAPVAVCTNGRHLTFSGDRWQLTTNLIEGEFPAWQQAIPDPAEPTIRAYGDQLIAALHRIKLVAGKDELRKVQIAAADDEWLRIWADLPDVGRQEDIVQGAIAHERVQFNLDHLTNAVIHLNKPTVEIEMETPMSPAIIRAPGYVALIMPIRG